ncbi:hypothetical protein INR49_025132 [Caranx melampygus]|nr:hypothetical protein INR49_025132 [Caranx melampygus]
MQKRLERLEMPYSTCKRCKNASGRDGGSATGLFFVFWLGLTLNEEGEAIPSLFRARSANQETN